MRVLCLFLLAVGAMAAPQASPEVPVTSSTEASSVEPTFPPASEEEAVAPPTAASEKQPAAGNASVVAELDEKTKLEVENIAEGFNQLRNLGVLDLEDEYLEEEGVVAGDATFHIIKKLKIKKLLKLAKIALVVLASQQNLTDVATQVEQLIQLLNVRDEGVAINALEIVSAAQGESNVADEVADELALALEQEEATKKVAEVLAEIPGTAVASLEGAAHGQILFAQSGGATVVMGTIVGLSPGKHKLAIYERGNCRVPGDRYDHSGSGEPSLGSIIADSSGRASILIRSPGVELTGTRGVLGRAVLVIPVAETRSRSPESGDLTTYAAAAQFVPSLDQLLADQPVKSSGDYSCGIIVRE